jgi:hypothetical protein
MAPMTGTVRASAPTTGKAKGGNEYVIRNINVNRVKELAKAACAQVEQASDYFTENVTGWEVVADDYLTAFERDQLEYEGRIIYSPVELSV